MGTRIWGQQCSGSTSCPRCSPGTDTRRRFPEIRSSPTFFPQPTRIRKPKGQPVSPPSPPHPTAAPTPGDISIPLLAPHQSPPAPAGTTLHPQKHWHRSPAPRLAWQKKEPTMCHNSPIVPRSHRAPSHPPRGCPTRSVPSRDPLLPSGWLVKAGGEGGMATVGTPTPAPRGAQQQVWGCCPGGATEGGCFMAETVLPHGWQGRGGSQSLGTCLVAHRGGIRPPGTAPAAGLGDYGRNLLPTAHRSPGSLLPQRGLEQGKHLQAQPRGPRWVPARTESRISPHGHRCSVSATLR